MRTNDLKEQAMPVTATPKRKRPVNLTLNVGLVAQAKTYTNNLSETMEVLLTEFVAQQAQAQHNRQKLANTCVSDWNALHARVGSFADEHVNL
jgi:antitoxin CcdA